MLNFLLGLALFSQLQLNGVFELPQIIEPEYSGGVLAAGNSGFVEVTMEVRDGFLINRIPQMQLNLQPVDGVTLAQTRLLSPEDDPKSTDTYYAEVPGFTVNLRATRPGSYVIPGELVYFFCNKADGYCSRQTVEVRIPIRAE